MYLFTEKGERNLEDIWLIVLPFESLFLACYLGLLVYAQCKYSIANIWYTSVYV